jgi:hypothetical protein
VASGNDGVLSESSDLADELIVAMQPADEAQPPVAEEPAEPPPVEPETVPPPTFARYRRSQFRLASVPNMFGDTLPPGGQVLVTKGVVFNSLADLPLAGGARRIKVSENNKALPMDRFIFNYNHFENALDVFYGSGRPLVQTVTSSPIDRYVIGIEKTFFDEKWSVDVRMPFVSRFAFSEPAPVFAVAGGEIGNLHVNVKRLLYASDCHAIAGGLGIDVPTGSDARGAALIDTFVVTNDAVHLMPFVGFLGAPNDCWFYHGFLEVDVPLNGHGVVVSDKSGVLNEQTLLNLDVSGGCWLYRNSCAPLLTGVAAVAEFHYTTTLCDADRFTLTSPTVVNYTFGHLANHVDIVNVTAGVHVEIARHTTLRVGGAFPLTEGTDRLFDAEMLVQLNRFF